MRPRIVVALSGGVDSSVAAALLKRVGFAFRQTQDNPELNRGVDVIGVFMKFWAPPSGATRINADSNADLRGFENRCCSPEAEIRARKVAKILKIPFYVLRLEKEFKKRIVDYFLKGYKEGQTPNPCVICNKEIKFGLLLEKALKLEADFIATGHYAKTDSLVNFTIVENTSKIKLLRAEDKEKDQSYFLWMLNQEQLKRILFPIGDYTRKEVENLAKKFKLSTAGIPKSQEICFIQKTVNDFLKKYLKEKPGNIVDTNGKVIGKHEGLWFYTIGQRKGIKLPGGPFYVADKNFKKNLLSVTKNEKDLYQKELVAKNVNWISGKEPKLPLKIKAKIRYRHQLAPATIIRLKSKVYSLKFKVAQRAITPGQSVVFYRGNKVLGGGVIS